MKKLLLVSAVLIGAASASQAAGFFNIGIGIPLPPLPGIVIGRPAPVYVPAPPPVCYTPPPVYCAPPVVYAPPPRFYGYGHREYRYRGHGWDHHEGGHR